MRAFVVVNPHSANGRTARDWPTIERDLRRVYSQLEIGTTSRRGEATGYVRIAKLFGGQFAFAFHSALHMLTYRDRAVRIRVDGAFDEIVSVSTVVVANGQYFGGGMRVAPNAKPDDGLFDVVIMGGASKGE